MREVIIPKFKDEIHQEQNQRDKQQNRTVFTPVTFETFTAWKKMYDLELAKEKEQLLKSSK